MHLAAARLLHWKLNLVAESFEHLHCRPASFGEQGIAHTGNEECDAHQPMILGHRRKIGQANRK
jgi:hypothetical protein